MANTLAQKGLAQAALTYKRQHRNTCYPEAMDGEALIAAEAIVRAYLSTVIPAEIAEVVEDLRGHTCGCGGPCGQKTPPYLRQAATLIERLAASQAETRRLALEEAAKLRTGDHVYHIPSGETWVVAWADYESGDMAPCGWPESMARISDCAVLKKADDAESAELVECLSKSGRRDAHRAARIRALIDQSSTEGGKDG